METNNLVHTTATILNEAHPRNHRRLVLLPLPLQGHLNPMLQLANILYREGFSITILHSQFNSPNPTKFPHLTFLPILCNKNEKYSFSDVNDLIISVTQLNKNTLEPIHDCLVQLMSDGLAVEEPVVCLITDAQWYLTQGIADELKLPRIVHRTSSVSSFLSFAAFPLLRDKYFHPFSEQELKSETLVPEVQPLKIKDMPKFITNNPEVVCELIELMVQGTKPAKAIIWNSFKELEEFALPTLRHDFPSPHFLIGPFHKCFPASSSSLLAQDQTSISWLDKQAPKSVLYVSFGSLAGVKETEFLEIAWGLANSKQPFLWVVRPGSIMGSKWLEPLPDGFLERTVAGRGYIVKWAPQQEVLAHPAIGGFFTHSGWNSTLESICEGVPMICSPCFGDQLPNARYVSDVWKVGVNLVNTLERKEIDSAIRRVMVEREGLEMRERVMCLKDKVNLCLKKGGSSYTSLEDLVNYILSF